MSNTLDTTLHDHGFRLVRQRKHRIYKDEAGRVWIVPATPSDSHALRNNLADLKNFLARGRSRGAFGFKVVADTTEVEL